MINTLKIWNESQKKLQSSILSGNDIAGTIALILHQHELVHVSEMAHLDFPTFEDELWDDMSEADFRRIPKKSIYTIAWHLWHSARIEDITVSFLLCRQPQILIAEKYTDKLNTRFRDTGNSMQLGEMEELSSHISKGFLREYRIAVGRRTRRAIKNLTPEKLNTKVTRDALEEIREQGAVAEDSRWLLEFWGRKKIAGIVLMPLTRHLLVHINEAKRLLTKKSGKADRPLKTTG